MGNGSRAHRGENCAMEGKKAKSNLEIDKIHFLLNIIVYKHVICGTIHVPLYGQTTIFLSAPLL
jgi:hypothetical protein